MSEKIPFIYKQEWFDELFEKDKKDFVIKPFETQLEEIA